MGLRGDWPVARLPGVLFTVFCFLFTVFRPLIHIRDAPSLAPGCAVSRGEMRRIPENDPAYRLKIPI